MRSASSGSRWSATTGAARSPGRAALRGDPRLTRLAIVNAPHPVIFQKSLIESAGAARRLAIYHAPSARPGFEKVVEAMGFDWFFDKTFSRPRRSRDDPGSREAAISSPTGRSPGAFDGDAQLVPRVEGGRAAAGRRRCRCPTGCCAPSPAVEVPTLVIWGMKDARSAPAPARRARRAGRRPDHRPPARRRPFRAVGSGRRGRRRARALPCRDEAAASAPAQ